MRNGVELLVTGVKINNILTLELLLIVILLRISQGRAILLVLLLSLRDAFLLPLGLRGFIVLLRILALEP